LEICKEDVNANVSSSNQVFWCIYSLALGSSTDQEVLYKELCKCGEEK